MCSSSPTAHTGGSSVHFHEGFHGGSFGCDELECVHGMPLAIQHVLDQIQLRSDLAGSTQPHTGVSTPGFRNLFSTVHTTLMPMLAKLSLQ